MTARDEHLSEALCFCHGIESASGHPLGAPGCQSTVTAGTYPSRSRNAPAHPRPSAMAADIYSALTKAAKTSAERKRWKAIADIAKAANREHSAQEAGSQRARKIRLGNLPKGTPEPSPKQRRAA